MTNLESAFRTLRAAWFNLHIRRRTPEREWATPEQEESMEADNRAKREWFDKQTQQIIDGDTSICIAPRCTADMGSQYE